MRLSLPEERLLAGKTSGLDAEPLSLTIDDDEANRDLAKSKDVYLSGARYTNEERDRVLARLHLGV